MRFFSILLVSTLIWTACTSTSPQPQQMGYQASITPPSETDSTPPVTVLRTNPQDPRLETAISSYREARFTEAIEQLSVIAEDASVGLEVRRSALHYLGRSYMARRQEEEARLALSSMIGLEPPPVELDPDVESPKMMRVYYDVRRTTAGDYEVEHKREGMKTLAILDFTNGSIEDHEKWNPLGKGIPSLMINQLNGATNLRVVERERIQWLLEELEMQRDANVVDQQTAVQAGKLLGAHAVLVGSYIAHGKEMVLNARLVNVETSEIMMAEQVQGKSGGFFDLTQELSLQVARGINVRMESTELSDRMETRSLDAMLSYSQGLDLLEKDSYAMAYEKFMEALEHDPGYSRARSRAESIRPLLASTG